MAKKTVQHHEPESAPENVFISGAGIVEEEKITDTLNQNYMPYAMSVIVSRALPEIDGFKPAHRKLLYTMYLMGLLNGPRTKSANVVGQTMKLNPHGDAAIYETMVRMARGNETLLHPFVDSKGNFGKSYSRDMMYAAARYTEVKLAEICSQLFSDIGKDTVDFIDNYDNTMKEPTLFPTTFPTVLVNMNLGIAVSLASTICSFNLAEVCETTAKLIKDSNHDIATTLKAPDFSGGGYCLYDEAAIRQIYDTGRGSVRIRSKYEVVPKQQRIEITEIPPSTSIEAIIDKISELMKAGKLREVNIVRDESDKGGLKIAVEHKRGIDGEQLMQKLFKLTPLEDSFSCNFTLLIKNRPLLLGVRDILLNWIEFRQDCVRRRTRHDLKIKQERLHLLDGLSSILLDIDRAIRIIRETEQEKEVIPNLMIGFGIDKIQADYIAEIKLRFLNREYILNRLSERDKLIAEIAELEKLLSDEKLIDKVIVSELAEVARKYVQPRKTKILYEFADNAELADEPEPDYPVTIFFTREGYFKKITPQSLRMSGEQRLKEGDEITLTIETQNSAHLLFFTNQHQVYKAKASDFADTKASAMGDYVASKLDMDSGETAVFMVCTEDYKGYVVEFFENGKAAKVSLSAFETKLNRKKLQKAYSAASALVAIHGIREDTEFALYSSQGKTLLVNSAFIAERQVKDTVGVNVMTLKKGATLKKAIPAAQSKIKNEHRYRTRKLPAAGAILHEEDVVEQLTLPL